MKKLTTVEFVQIANLIHKNKYKYSNANYIACKIPIQITCSLHGDFFQSPEKHLRGRGCKQCGIQKQKHACMEKYGVENPFNNKSIQLAIQKTIVDKYGGMGASSKTISEKIKITNNKKYGVDNVFSNKEINKKCTTSKNYKNISKKTKTTVQKKYGVACSLLIDKGKGNRSLKVQFLDSIFNGNRLQEKFIPLFTKDEYLTVNTKYKFKCCACEDIIMSNLDDGGLPRCYTCNPHIPSKYEQEIYEYMLSIYDGKIITRNRTILNGLELDFYLPEEQLAIEFNGNYFHSEISGRKNKNYHLNKTQECLKQNIKLIHIFEDEWIDKSDIIKSKLNYILKAKTKIIKLHARKCVIRELNPKDCNLFLKENHLQSTDKSSIKLGLYSGNCLVSVMTFGGLRVALGNKHIQNEYEMYRFCILKNHSISGAFSKLFRYFTDKYNPKKITSYADARWSSGNVYQKTNFNQISWTSPNYWYLNSGHKKRYHRYSYRKNILNQKLSIFNSDLTEWENMKLNGYDRIWDCGNLKYEWSSDIK